MSLNTTTLDDNVHEDMRTGVVMLDLFGGIGAGLEALLRDQTVHICGQAGRGTPGHGCTPGGAA